MNILLFFLGLSWSYFPSFHIQFSTPLESQLTFSRPDFLIFKKNLLYNEPIFLIKVNKKYIQNKL